MNQLDYSNPYQSPSHYTQNAPQFRLAGRLKRFAGALLDSFAVLVSLIPGGALFITGSIMANSSSRGPDAAIPFILGGFALLFLGVLVVFAIQIYLHATASQSIGKYLLKMQIIDFTTHQRSPFVQCFLLRSVVGVFLLGQVPFYGIVDVCFIFRDDYRCIHDLIGNTIVVDLD